MGLTSLLFFPVFGQAFNVQAAPALGPLGISVLFGAFIFGIGMQLGGGCGSGTLFTMGQGQVDMLITLAFFIVGATLGSAHLHWWLALPSLEPVSLVQSLGWWQGLMLQGLVLAVLYWLVGEMDRRRNQANKPLQWGVPREQFAQRFIHSPWPLWWGIIGLAGLNLATLFSAGHPWTITFAFGL